MGQKHNMSNLRLPQSKIQHDNNDDDDDDDDDKEEILVQ